MRSGVGHFHPLLVKLMESLSTFLGLVEKNVPTLHSISYYTSPYVHPGAFCFHVNLIYLLFILFNRYT